MTDVICPECGGTTDRLYKLPYGAEKKGWMCEDCVFDYCETAYHWRWSDEDFKKEGIERVEKEQ